MPNLIPNPKFNASIPTSNTNQPYIFESPETTIINPLTGQTAAQATTGTPGPITSQSLQPVAPINLPVLPPDTTNYAGIIAGGIIPPPVIPPPAPPAPSSLEDLFTQYLGEQKPPPSIAGAYAAAGGVAPTGAEITGLQQGVLAGETAVQEATDELNSLNAQMQALNAEAQAVPIQMQESAAGRGITAGGLAPLQTAALRDIALRSLPLQGQIFGAQAKQAAAQGKANLAQRKLDLAQGQFDRYFELVVKDMEIQYNYRNSLIDKVFSYATKKEQQRLDELKVEADRAYQESRDNVSLAQKWATEAISAGNSNIAAKISALNPSDPDFLTKLGELQGQIVIKPKEITEREMVADLAAKYVDAGIVLTDTLATAQTKLAGSRIYQEQVRGPQEQVRGPQAPKPSAAEPENINNILYSVGIPYTAVTTKGKLTNSQLTKLSQGGIPPTDAQEIMDEILAGKTLEDIRQWMKSLGVDPKVLDTFMMTLQGITAGGGEETPINPFRD